MTLLLDTHILLWVAADSPRLSEAARATITSRRAELAFSSASIWEIAIKAAQGRADFEVDTRVLRRQLLAHGFVEVEITGAHAIEAAGLPDVHRDPFDRMLVAQARTEAATLLTSDAVVARYGSPVLLV